MAMNQKVTDLIVKSVVLKRKVGGQWVAPPETHFLPESAYCLDIAVGNKDGRISYEDEQYRKDNVSVRVVADGFVTPGTPPKQKNKIIFYTNGSFSTPVTGTQSRTAFEIEVFETHHADAVVRLFLKTAAGIAGAIQLFRWDIGVYASVRGRHWRKIATSV